MQRAADEPPMLHLHGPVLHPDATLCRRFFQHGADLAQQLFQIKGHGFQHHFSGFQLAHIQHFVHQFQQQGGGVPDLFAALGLLAGILREVVGDLHHAPDAIDWRADIVAHALQKFRLCHIGGFRLLCLGPELLLVLLLPAQLLFPVALGRFPAQSLHQHEHHRIAEHRKQHIARRSCKHIRFPAEHIDVEISSALDHAKAAGRAAQPIVDMHHLAVAGLIPDGCESRHFVDAEPHQRRIVGGRDLFALRHHNGAVDLQVIALHDVPVREIVVAHIFF